ncbi:hypothetical protein HY639_05615, partial [Candidatus Woesearchaeota archaeon]|nr:hypothetical protein [Candidatus Woesearchaeota archaeon]
MNKCNVCGQGIEDRIVHCCACDTIHHQECFDYTGNCSVYGCGSTEYHINGQEVYIGKQSSTLECLVIAPSRPIYLPTPETLTDFIA